MVDPDQEKYERNKGVGASNYHITDLTMPTIDRPPADYSERAKQKAGPLLDVVEWVWTEFDVAGGKGFLNSIVEPLAGNYNSIAANGEAWKKVGEQFGALVENMGNNTLKLAQEHWVGAAAEEFGRFIEMYWKKGAAWAGEQIGIFLKKGFEKVGQFAKSVAEEVIDVIELIMRVVERLAVRLAPVVGQVWTVIEFFLDLFGLADSVLADINKLVGLYEKITGLFEQIKSMVSSMGDYFQAFGDVLDTVRRIPEIDTFADAAQVTEDITGGVEEMSQKKTEIEQKVGEADQTLTDIEQQAKEAGG